MTEETNTQNSEVRPEIQPESSLSQPEPEPEQLESSSGPESVVSQQQTAPSVVVPPSKLTPKELWVRFREKVIERKSKKLEKIVALALKDKQITNDDVEKLLHVSDATATRYLQELVRQGRLKRSGTTSGITYEPTS